MATIYMGTVLLEKNRWSTKIPTFKVSEWAGRFKEDGFDGMELWENHAMLCDEEELDAIKRADLPVSVYNSYVNFDNGDEERRKRAAQLVSYLGAKAVKYNFGKDISALEEYIRNLYAWAELLPEECRILCECHPGTVMEDPAIAAKVFKEFGDSRFQVIVHALMDPKELGRWFDNIGDKITHSHIQLRDNNLAVKLRRKPQHVRNCMEVLGSNGYKGTFTIEFTEGIRTPDENMNDLYACAQDDLIFLRDVIEEAWNEKNSILGERSVKDRS